MAFPVPQGMGSRNEGKVPSRYWDTGCQHPTVWYLPERVELGPLWDGVLARLVLVYPIVVHCFAIDEGEGVGAVLLPFSQPGRKEKY